MNWYSIFYWVAVADSIRTVSGVLSCVLGAALVIFAVGFIICSSNEAEHISSEDKAEAAAWGSWAKSWKKLIWPTSTMFLIFTLFWMFVPSKKDFAIIIAGGAVGQFVTKDTAVKQLPSEVIGLLRDKIRELRAESISGVTDTLKEKTKEELLEIIKQQQK